MFVLATFAEIDLIFLEFNIACREQDTRAISTISSAIGKKELIANLNVLFRKDRNCCACCFVGSYLTLFLRVLLPHIVFQKGHALYTGINVGAKAPRVFTIDHVKASADRFRFVLDHLLFRLGFLPASIHTNDVAGLIRSRSHQSKLRSLFGRNREDRLDHDRSLPFDTKVAIAADFPEVRTIESTKAKMLFFIVFARFLNLRPLDAANATSKNKGIRFNDNIRAQGRLRTLLSSLSDATRDDALLDLVALIFFVCYFNLVSFVLFLFFKIIKKIANPRRKGSGRDTIREHKKT